MGRRKAYDIPGHVHFLTFSVFDRLQVFANPTCARAFLTAVDEAKQRHGFELFGYVVMPDHVHMVVRPSEGRKTAEVLASSRDWRRPESIASSSPTSYSV